MSTSLNEKARKDRARAERRHAAKIAELKRRLETGAKLAARVGNKAQRKRFRDQRKREEKLHKKAEERKAEIFDRVFHQGKEEAAKAFAESRRLVTGNLNPNQLGEKLGREKKREAETKDRAAARGASKKGFASDLPAIRSAVSDVVDAVSRIPDIPVPDDSGSIGDPPSTGEPFTMAATPISYASFAGWVLAYYYSDSGALVGEFFTADEDTAATWGDGFGPGYTFELRPVWTIPGSYALLEPRLRFTNLWLAWEEAFEQGTDLREKLSVCADWMASAVDLLSVEPIDAGPVIDAIKLAMEAAQAARDSVNDNTKKWSEH